MKDHLKYLLFLPLITLFIGIAGIAGDGFGLSLNIFTTMFAASFVISVLPAAVVYFLNSMQPRESKAQEIYKKYGGKLEVIGRVRNQDCSSVQFKFGGKDIEFLDTYAVYVARGRARITQKELLIRIAVAARFTLTLRQSAGSTFIGKTLDKILAAFTVPNGCEKIPPVLALKDYSGLDIYSDNEVSAVNFLSDERVKPIFLKYFHRNQGSCMSFPINLNSGFIEIVFSTMDGGHHISWDPATVSNFDEFLTDLVCLAGFLDSHP